MTKGLPRRRRLLRRRILDSPWREGSGDIVEAKNRKKDLYRADTAKHDT